MPRPEEFLNGRSTLSLYEPINVLKPVASDVWIVDGPPIEYDLRLVKFPFSTRMTVLRLRNGDLALHSPVALTPELRSAVDVLGPVRFLIAPNSLHYWWVPDWKAAIPNAEVLAVRGLQKRAKRPIEVDRLLVGRHSPWPGEVDLLVVRGDVLTEAVLFHRATRTLILTDLIENFEPKRVHSWFLKLLVKLAGAADPDGKAPIDMRLSFLRRRKALRTAVQQMLAWRPERVIISHGRWYDKDGTAELRRAFRWVL
ncbi:DUF4336 domain-containing protein [Mesorhizobium sp. B4-1-3]|uniref:DUF4336 domain-containing protein n=1 Tax=Mesorhizobium sp. B4-1-3 TaxID=2589889 RepID=UPI00112E30A0|nr:DUF4336 domain-containing protein [Mesorhizobium sp. B4-1-3]TPI10451.1 DUF4336 domain-containing protein [Mesorhizobium sp. B4-1-3]